MRLANSQAGSGGPAAFALITVALLIAAVTASTAAGTVRTSVFCQKAAIFGQGQNLLTLPPSTIKADDASFKAMQPTMLSHTPSSIKPGLQQIFTFDNGLFTALSKVGWSVAKLPKSELQTLAVSGPKLKPVSDKVIGYIDTTCGLKLKKP